MKKGDLVKFATGGVGEITRIAKDGKWADVNILGTWSKRVPDPKENLVVVWSERRV